MTTLASAVAIGDNQIVIDAPLAAGQVPGFVKIGTELLDVGGADNRLGTTLVLSRPATATHSQGATVTYAGRPYDADFLAATAGAGGGGVTLDNTVDPPAEVTTIIAPGADLVGDAVTLGAWELIAVGDESVSLNRDVEAPGDGDAFAKTIVDAGGVGTASAITDVNNTGSGDADATSSATAATGSAINGTQAHVEGGAGGAAVTVSATVDGSGAAEARLMADGTDDGPATTYVEALTIDADAIVQLTANADDGAVSTTLVLTAPTGGVASLVITGLPTADPGVGNKLWNDTGTLKITAAA